MAVLRVAAVQYRFTAIKRFEDFAKKNANIVQACAKKDAHLIVFPEYLGYHLSVLSKKSAFSGCDDHIEEFLEFFKKLSQKTQILIQAGTIPSRASKGKYFNRAYLFYPNGKFSYQDKINLTPYEKSLNLFSSGKEIKIFDTPWGKISIAICYDSEFPPIIKETVRKGVQTVLVPSSTETLAGYHRVALSSRARAIENQCFVVHSCTVGEGLLGDGLWKNMGRAGIFSPCDGSFPHSGILAEGKLNSAGVITADLNFAKLKDVRKNGQVLNYQDYTLSI